MVDFIILIAGKAIRFKSNSPELAYDAASETVTAHRKSPKKR